MCEKEGERDQLIGNINRDGERERERPVCVCVLGGGRSVCVTVVGVVGG